MTKRDGALVEAQRRMRSMAARQDLILRGWFKAAAELESLGAEEQTLRARHEAELEVLGARRSARDARLAEMTAAVAVILGDDARAAEVLGTSERKVIQARRSVSLPDVTEAIDRVLKARQAMTRTSTPSAAAG
ncbi:MAG: hypothetical protein ACYCTI_00610 [Acidimicrobiales bacterium]